MDVPSAIKTEGDAVAVFHIYNESWESARSGEKSALIDAAHKLRNYIIKSQDASSCIYNCVDALRWFASEKPIALDFVVDVFRKAAADLPSFVEHNYGKGFKGAENIFKYYLEESSTNFQGDIAPQGLGKEDTANAAAVDSSNLLFEQIEVFSTPLAVAQKLKDQQKARLDIIVLLALQGRCHSKGFARLRRAEASTDHVGNHATMLINHILNRQRAKDPPWSKADFIACCILMRACAKSLTECLPPDMKDVKILKWKEGFASFLHKEGGGKNVDEDFAIKIHAARVLENLHWGPRDEDSTELFDLANWVF